MNANELRIGNYILDGKDVWEVDNATIFTMVDHDEEWHYKPIPLTEEWLVRFGFNDYKDRFSLTNGCCDDDFWIEIVEEIKGVREKMFCLRYSKLNLHIEHVHQLQNLYFALTGQEL